jgi:hypothetical protein
MVIPRSCDHIVCLCQLTEHLRASHLICLWIICPGTKSGTHMKFNVRLMKLSSHLSIHIYHLFIH